MGNLIQFKLKMYFLLLKVTLLHGSFSRFLNCTNSTKSRKASHLFRVEYFDSMNYAWFGKLKAVLNAVVLWNEILNLINVIITLLPSCSRRGTFFNTYIMSNIISFIILRGVFRTLSII